MSTYVISDVHGCYDELMKMLELINFSEEDKLIIAGDYIDRGPQNLEMLRLIENTPSNVILLRGNHDEEFAYCIDLMAVMFQDKKLPLDDVDTTKKVYMLLQELSARNTRLGSFDYYGTIKRLIWNNNISMEQLDKWNDCIRQMPFVYKEQIGERTLVVVHGGYVDSFETLNNLETEESYESLEDFDLYARDDAYMYGGINDGIVVAGHTPTVLDEEFTYNDGKVYRFYDEKINCILYDIDCGCAYRPHLPNARLACIRVEDEKIFYV